MIFILIDDRKSLAWLLVDCTLPNRVTKIRRLLFGFRFLLAQWVWENTTFISCGQHCNCSTQVIFFWCYVFVNFGSGPSRATPLLMKFVNFFFATLFLLSKCQFLLCYLLLIYKVLLTKLSTLKFLANFLYPLLDITLRQPPTIFPYPYCAANFRIK